MNDCMIRQTFFLLWIKLDYYLKETHFNVVHVKAQVSGGVNSAVVLLLVITPFIY